MPSNVWDTIVLTQCTRFYFGFGHLGAEEVYDKLKTPPYKNAG